MAAVKMMMTSLVIKQIIHNPPFLKSIPIIFQTTSLNFRVSNDAEIFRITRTHRYISSGRIRCMAASDSGDKKFSSRLSQVQQLIQEAEERSLSAVNEPPAPKIALEHVSVSFARSGGPGGQNVNKVNTKVDMRFNVKKAYWLSDRIRERILQLEKNRINKDGEIVISSTKTRTQKGNIEDALGKLQAIIDAASYVPPPPSEEQKKKIAKMAAIGEQKRLQSKKALSQKKAIRRTRDSYD